MNDPGDTCGCESCQYDQYDHVAHGQRVLLTGSDGVVFEGWIEDADLRIDQERRAGG